LAKPLYSVIASLNGYTLTRTASSIGRRRMRKSIASWMTWSGQSAPTCTGGEYTKSWRSGRGCRLKAMAGSIGQAWQQSLMKSFPRSR